MSNKFAPLSDGEIQDLTPAKLRRQLTDASDYVESLLNFENIMCYKCGKIKYKTEFYPREDLALGVYPQCKKCLQMEGENRKTEKDPANESPEAMQRVLYKLNLPYYDSLYKTFFNRKKEHVANKAGNYYNSITIRYINIIKTSPEYSNKTWSDSQFGSSQNEIEKEFKASTDEEKIILESAKKRFGIGYGDRDLIWLENEYQDWVTRNPCDNKAQEVLFVTLCAQTLEANKARKEGRQTKDIDKAVQDTMSALGIKPSQNDTSALTDTLTFSQLIDKWEENDPIPEPSEEFKDVDNIGKYIRVWFAGWLGKIIGIKNAYTRECEEEVEKYIVKGAQEESSRVSDEIYETIFGKDE